jgi:putative SOS response-associated peptidase YedK
MCGRYVRRSDKHRIAEHFHVYGPSVPDFGPSWNVAPQTLQPVVRLNRDTREREIVMMRWGLIPYWILLENSQRVSASYRKPVSRELRDATCPRINAAGVYTRMDSGIAGVRRCV